MSTALTRLAANGMQRDEILRTECAGCGHSLRSHPVSARIEGSACRYFEWKKTGHLKVKQVHCKCKAFEDDGQGALDV